MGTTVGATLSASASHSGASSRDGSRHASGNSLAGGAGGSLGFESANRGATTEAANANLNIVNYDVRSAISEAEVVSARAERPEEVFAHALSIRILGSRGLRNQYIEQADSARGTFDISGPLTSREQSALLGSGRFSDDLARGPFDGDPAFKERKDE